MCGVAGWLRGDKERKERKERVSTASKREPESNEMPKTRRRGKDRERDHNPSSCDS